MCVENLTGFDDIVCEFAPCISTYLIKSWISSGCSYEFNVVYVQLEKSQYLLHYNNIWRSHFQEWKSKEIIKIYFFIFFSFISVCSSLQICYNENTRLQHSTWWGRNELINHSEHIIGSGQKQRPVFFNKNCSEKFGNIYWKIPVLESLLIKKFKATLLKRDSYTGIFLSILGSF